mgnify:CR=1 FL=1|jgi:hypothetical protein|tara:strand:- start:1092 stop:1598 length:507 start_codon:yes stop_codon:yes gene_type:complete
MNRQQHTFTNIKTKVNTILSHANSLGFKRIEAIDRHESHVHDNLETLSDYEFISSRAVAKNNELFNAIEDLAETIGLKDKVLVSSFMQLQSGDFLEWSDIDYWQENTIGKFFSIALTSGNSIEFKDGIVQVPQYGAIAFNTGDVHRIQTVNSKQTWLVLMIPDYFNLV